MISSPLKQIAGNQQVASKLDYFVFNISINPNATLTLSSILRSKEGDLPVFATDSFGGEFTFIGNPEHQHIAYINSEGQIGKIAESLEEFFTLVLYYPYWRELLKEKYAEDTDDRQEGVHQAENLLSEVASYEGKDLQEEIFKMAQLLGLERRVDTLDNFYKYLSEDIHKHCYSIENGEECKSLLQD